MRTSLAFIIIALWLSTGVFAEIVDNVPVAAPTDRPKSTSSTVPTFTHEGWGRCSYGEGYVYGTPCWRDSVAVVDFDEDSDDDIVFWPYDTEKPLLMRNLGTSGAFYPGGAQEIDIPPPEQSGFDWPEYLDLVMDFADLTGDGRPDLVATAYGSMGADSYAYVVWYENTATGFVFRETIYGTPPGVYDLCIDLADINADGLVDLFIMVPVLDASDSTAHHIWLIKNVGTQTSPSWATPEFIPTLTNLMPPPHAAKAQGAAQGAAQGTAQGAAQKEGKANTGVYDPRDHLGMVQNGLTSRVSDIEIVDWNVDGRLDFMFYDVEHGIDFVRNLGTTQVPSWESVLNGGTAPIPWRHTDLTGYGIPEGHHAPMDAVFGSFAVHTNPGAYLPGAKWLDDFYIDMDNWLITRRWLTQDSSYHLLQENVLALATGQGPPEFWDYDGDSDLDLFRTGIGDESTSALLLFPNVGTIYAPAWGEHRTIASPTLNVGTPDNTYRQDLFTFSDHDADGVTHLFIQRQTGAIAQYRANQAASSGALPTFTLVNSNFGDIVFDGQTGVSPGGLTIADFNANGEDKKEIIAAYASDQGGKIIWYAPPSSGYSETLADMSTFLDDEEGDPLDENMIQSVGSADLDLDGRIDLVVARGSENWSHLVYYRNVDNGSSFYFDCIGLLHPADSADAWGGQTISFVDIDGDGDEDLFKGHRMYYRYDGYVEENFRSNWWRFSRNTNETGLKYWRTRVVEGQSWRLYWNNQLPQYDFITNSSGGSISNPGRYTAGSISPTVDVIQSTNLDEDVRVFVDVLPPVTAAESKAVIVVGGSPTDSLHGTFAGLADYAYWVLRTEGLPPASIRFLCSNASFDADGDGVSDIYGAPTLAALQTAVTQWGAGTDRLLVYLIDHGQRERFRINNTEYLEASTYAQWLETLRDGGAGPQVTTLIDTCEAGSFIDNLAISKDAQKAAAERITITSSGIGPIEGIALFDTTQYLSFSLSFWQEIFNGGTYGQAFKRASVAINSINPLQVPQIDDDGDGVPNESNDGLLAESARPGADFELPGTGVVIGQVAPQQVISSSSAMLWLSDVYTNFPVEAAGALVVPPNYQRPSLSGDDEQPVTGLQWIDFNWDAGQSRWEGTYSGFSEGGLYRIQYYAKAGGRYYASPRIGYVDRIGAPDAWESDNTYSTAKWLPFNSVQGHNFHASGDNDWMRFTATAGMNPTLAIISPGYRCQAVVRLYRLADLRANSSASAIYQVSASKPGDQVVFDYTFSTSGEYVMRVSNLVSTQYGEGTSYMALLAIGTGGGTDIVPTTLLVTVLDNDTQAPIAGVTVQFQGSLTAITTADGVAQFLCSQYGNYSVATTKTGYNDASRNVSVNNLFEETTFSLTKSGSEGEGEGEDGGGCGTLDPGNITNGRGSGGNGCVLLFAWTALLLATKLGDSRQRRVQRVFSESADRRNAISVQTNTPRGVCHCFLPFSTTLDSLCSPVIYSNGLIDIEGGW